MDTQTLSRLRQMINIAYAVLIGVAVFLVLKYALKLVLPFIIAFAIVSLLHPLIRGLKKAMKTQHPFVSFIVMLIFFLGVGTGLFFLILHLVFWLHDIFLKLPAYYDTVLVPSFILIRDNISTFLNELPPDWQYQLQVAQTTALQEIQAMIMGLSQRGLSVVSAFTAGIPGFLIAFIFTIMTSFFLSMQYDTVVKFLKYQPPKKVRESVAEIIDILQKTVLKYLSAYIKIMCVTFIEVFIGLSVLKVEGAILIALIIAVFDALPVLGTGAIVIPWAVIECIKGNFALALGLIILYAIVTIVRNIVEPKIVGDKLGLNPIVSLTSIYLGFQLIGVLGMIIMPMLTQILLQLHRRGKLKLFRELEEPTPQATPEG